MDGPRLQKEMVKVMNELTQLKNLNTDECIPDGGIMPHVLSMGKNSWSLG